MKITINDRRRPYSVEKFSSLIDFIGPLSIHYEKAGKSWSVPFSSGWAAGIIAAAAEAIEAAGYDLDEDIAGRGWSMTREAVKAIAESLYPGSPVYVLEANA